MPSRRWPAIAVLLALAIASASGAPFAKAADTARIRIWLQPERSVGHTICVGDSVPFSTRIFKRVGVNEHAVLQRLYGVRVSASVVGGPGTISPASSSTTVGGSFPGSASFTFHAEAVGTAVLQFSAQVNQWHVAGFAVGGDALESSLSVKVEDCKYRVSANSWWRAPGPARLTLLARIELAGLVAAADGSFRGTARVQWFTYAAQVGDCSGTLTPDSTAQVLGVPSRRGTKFAVDINYQTAIIPLVVDCTGAGGTRDVPVTPQPVTESFAADGGSGRFPHVLEGPPTPTGSIQLTVGRTAGQ